MRFWKDGGAFVRPNGITITFGSRSHLLTACIERVRVPHVGVCRLQVLHQRQSYTGGTSDPPRAPVAWQCKSLPHRIVHF